MERFAIQAEIWPGDGQRMEGHLVIEGGRISAVEPGPYHGSLPVTRLDDMSVSPGMIDLMVLGGFNRSILRDDPLDIARAYVRLGVTGCQFCIASLPIESIHRVADNVRAAMGADDPLAARVLGLYLEGPFQQPDLTGASMRQFALDPTEETVRSLLDACGPAVTMINVAPGLPGDARAVRLLRAAGKVVSMAHSNAPAECVLACIDAGTTVLGHAWDNNSGLLGDTNVQQPTLEHVALTDERVRFLHLICDGAHVHPILIRMMLRCRGFESLCLVTDAVIRAGCPDGPYVNDDGRTFVKRGGVGRTDRGTLCGSALLLPDHFRNLVKFCALPPEQAVRAVTLNPAASLGLDGTLGLLAPGRTADVVAWDRGLRVRRVWKAGRELPDVSDYAEVIL